VGDRGRGFGTDKKRPKERVFRQFLNQNTNRFQVKTHSLYYDMLGAAPELKASGSTMVSFSNSGTVIS
jgi:hypothetical protein